MFYYVDLTGLLILTYVQSNEYFLCHAIGFGLFLTGSVLYMITNLIVNSKIGRHEVKFLKER